MEWRVNLCNTKNGYKVVKRVARATTLKTVTNSWTYVYQEHMAVDSFKLAPVSPEHGMKWMSFLGLKPTFFKNGTSFSLHSSYLRVQKDETQTSSKMEEYKGNFCYARSSVVMKCEMSPNIGKCKVCTTVQLAWRAGSPWLPAKTI